MTVELQTAYTTGSANCTNGSNLFTFTSAPAASLEGYHFQLTNKPTVYKILQHTGGNATASLDSNLIESSSTTYGFRAFKLDYMVEPTYIQVDSFNDKIDFAEGSGTLAATLTHGAYTPSNYISHVATQVQTNGTRSYTGAWDSTLRKFSLTASGTFSLFATGTTNVFRSALPTIGFDQVNQTGAAVYTAAYTPNQIARLIEPFKLFSFSAQERFIFSTDTQKMHDYYPIARIEQAVPNRFARLTETIDGRIEVRFNSYPKDKTKTVLDWIPQPLDLQNNTVSRVLLPRGDVDVLIHGAAAFIAFDKEDSKFDSLLALCKAGLQAMQQKNRSLLHRTGELFGQILTRPDLESNGKISYGYTNDGQG